MGDLFAPWTKEPPVVPESKWSPWAHPGWLAWNGHAVEVQVAEFLARLASVVASHIDDPVVMETGTGQGFVTRRVAHTLSGLGRLWCFESDHDWRERLKGEDFFVTNLNACVKKDPTPDWIDFRTADLTILDSNDPWRKSEICLWSANAQKGALLFVHDTGTLHPPHDGHFSNGFLIKMLGLTGYFLENPRGGFLAQKGRTLPDPEYRVLWDEMLENVYSFK